MTPHVPSRRLFLASAAAAPLFARGAFANLLEDLTKTPPATEGPFYPNKLPLDTDNDLIVVNDALTPAVGEITHLTGKVLDPSGNPVKHAVVEIWQCDAGGVYLHTADSGPNKAKQEKNFQGFGRFATGSTGEYYFRTIKPVLYSGRAAPHIHVKVKKGGKELLCTQCYVKGEKGNDKDGIFKAAAKTPEQRKAIEIPFEPIKDSKIGELAANFVIVLGKTPGE
ncbi:MAG: intradiol ring-cleavage dioxygenase [Gemmataceae bacterium]|nr:intradiol ring-cleavage dioxygenase [Gemmataceae bacterium]